MAYQRANGDLIAPSAATCDQYNASTVSQLVLMDINMPVFGGFEATQKIRTFEQQKCLEKSIIIALIGLRSADAQQEALDSGFDFFLTKPIRFVELTKLQESLQIR